MKKKLPSFNSISAYFIFWKNFLILIKYFIISKLFLDTREREREKGREREAKGARFFDKFLSKAVKTFLFLNNCLFYMKMSKRLFAGNSKLLITSSYNSSFLSLSLSLFLFAFQVLTFFLHLRPFFFRLFILFIFSLKSFSIIILIYYIIIWISYL